MPEVPENTLLMTAGETAKQLAEPVDGGCFQPFIIPRVSASAAPKPVSKPKPRSIMPAIDEVLRDHGILPTPNETKPETEFPAPAAAEGKGDAEMVQPSEILTVPVEAQLPPPRVATADELFAWIKQCVLAQAQLSEDAAELVAFFVISTWCQEALTVLPCLVISGSAHDAGVVLHVLKDFCRNAALVAGIRRSHLGVLHCACRTKLIWEPNLDRRTASLLSGLTDRNYMVVERGSMACYSKSAAIYVGQDPESHQIVNSIRVHIPVTNAAPLAPPQWLTVMNKRLPVHLDLYRRKNLALVGRRTWVPSGLSSETAAIATALGRGIVDAPALLQKLVVLLKTEDKHRQSELSNTTDAIVLEATRTLCRDGREHAYAREIAAAANHLFEARGEAARLSPEKAGHSLKRLGLPTHPLSQTGHGLKFDRATIARIEPLCAVYGMEDTPAEAENLHSSQTTENK
jgi:hypothetical protein